jgi:WD40-like Beta Propeller Repeat
MSSVEWERVRTLFQAALEQPQGKRDLFLSTACQDDERLRREVTSLLAAHAAAGGFLETPAVRFEDRPVAGPPLALQPGNRVGTFEVLVTMMDAGRASGDVWMLPTATAGTPRSLLTGSFVERDARFSPDGDLIAYVSYESGGPEISVRTVEGTPQREGVSVGGGTQPVWRRDGAELLFVDLDGLLRSVAVHRTGDGRPIVGNATRVNVLPIGAEHTATQYDLSPDGRRVYFLDRRPAEAPREIGIVLEWHALLR